MSIPEPTPREPYSYHIYIDPYDGLIKAKNGLTGAIAFRGPDPAIVIQQAMNSLPNGGKICLNRLGIVDVDSINIPPNLPFEIYSVPPTILRHKAGVPDNHHMFFLSEGARDIYLHDLVLDGNKDNQTSTVLDLVFGNHADNIRIERCQFRNIKRCAVHFYNDAEDIYILNNVFDNSDQTHIRVATFSAETAINSMNIHIVGNLFKNCINNDVLDLYYVKDVWVERNKFYNVMELSVYPNYAGNKEPSRNINIIGNILYAGTLTNRVAIKIRGLWIGEISRNYIYDYGYGILLEPPSNITSSFRDIIISENIMKNIGGETIYAILQSAVNTTLTYCSIINNDLEGNRDNKGTGIIWLGATGSGNIIDRITISGNRIYGIYSANEYGIRAINNGVGTITRINVFGNIIENLATPILLDGSGHRIKTHIGFDTETFKATGLSVSIGVNGAYGSATSIKSLSGVITYPRIKITWGGTFGTGETVTVKVEAVYSDSSTVYVERSATAVGSLWLSDDDILTLIANGKDIIQLNVYAKTNLSSTSVTVTVDAYGKG
jgi:hypothetical protein